jgi:hypothetical protein
VAPHAHSGYCTDHSSPSYAHRTSLIRDLPPQETLAGDTDYRHPQWEARGVTREQSAVLVSKINRSHCELLGCDVSVYTATLYVTTLLLRMIPDGSYQIPRRMQL